MTPKNVSEPRDEDSLGVLDDAASLDTACIGILSRTAQVSVILPHEDEDELDDGVVDGEIVANLVADEMQPVEAAPLASWTDAVDSVVGEAAESGANEASADVPAEERDAPPASPTPEEAPPVAAEPVIINGPLKSVDPVASAGPVTSAPLDEAVSVVMVAPVDKAAAARARLARARAELEAAAQPASARAETEKEEPVVEMPNERPATAQPKRSMARTEAVLTSKRLDDLGESSRESADLLTADRLLDPQQVSKPEPEGAWSHFLYTLSGRRINIGDGRRARQRKALTARISAPLAGGARFVPILSRKGGVGKTAVTVLLGMALADAREDRVIAVDANPDRGTLAERVARLPHSKSVRDLVRIHGDVKGYNDISAIVARDATRLDVLASDADPRIAEAFSDGDYRDVAEIAAHYYSLVLTDTGTGIVHSVMSATLDLADQIVIVSGLSVDEARLASETLTWLESNGHAEWAREAIVVLNQSTPGTPLVRLNELEAHFATRSKTVVRMPYDPQIAGGGTIVFANLQPETRAAARELAALLVEGLRVRAA